MSCLFACGVAGADGSDEEGEADSVIDSRCETAREELLAARQELKKAEPEIDRVGALLDDARSGIVELVESGLGGNMTLADMNQLDAARQVINRALEFLQKKAWARSYASQFIDHAIEHVELSMSNVVPFPDQSA